MYNSFQEMIEGEGISKNSDIYYFLLAKENKQNRKKRSPKINKNLQENKEECKGNLIESIFSEKKKVLGRILSSKELDILFSQGKYKCGYLRDVHMYEDVYTGLCALTKNFDACEYPRVFCGLSQDYCPIHKEFHKKACEEYQESLKKANLTNSNTKKSNFKKI